MNLQICESDLTPPAHMCCRKRARRQIFRGPPTAVPFLGGGYIVNSMFLKKSSDTARPKLAVQYVLFGQVGDVVVVTVEYDPARGLLVPS